jgi:glycosyltransferase involved in cell wall biosynthesis
LDQLKQTALKKNIGIQIIVVDNCSDKSTRDIIGEYGEMIDNLIVEKDKGQYDAINKGLKLVKGAYWTWLNTDDLIDMEGFFQVADYLKTHPDTDYVYGDVIYIDEEARFLKKLSTGELSLTKLVHEDASICQPGSFFRKKFTDNLGELSSFHFAFDYEYILRCLKNKAKIFKLNVPVARFRYYKASKSGSQDYRFLKEQLVISKLYGGRFLSKLSLILRLRIIKRKLFN